MNNGSSVQIRLSALLPSFEPSAVELRVRDRLPLPKAQREQLGPPLCVAAVAGAHVVRIGGQVDAGRPLAKLGVGVGPGDPVARGPIGRLQADLACALELRGVRVPRSLAVPVVEDAGRIAALLRGHAPIPHRKGAVLLPASARDLEATLAIARAPEEADRRGLLLGAQGQRMLPPVTLEPGQSAFVLDRLAEPLV